MGVGFKRYGLALLKMIGSDARSLRMHSECQGRRRLADCDDVGGQQSESRAPS